VIFMLLTEAYDSFLVSKDVYCSNHTVFNYSNTLRYFCDFIKSSKGDDCDICDITLSDLNNYSIYLKTKTKNSSGDLISSRTRKDYLKDVKCFFNYLCENDLLCDNPADKLKLPRVYLQPVEPLTNAEVDAIDACYNRKTMLGCRNLAIIHCLLDMGMRSGEVQRLKLDDIHFDDKYVVIKNSKGGKGRIVPLPAVSINYLLSYLMFYRPSVLHGYVFCTNVGKPLSSNSIKCLFDRLKDSSGVKRVYPHLLRHTFGTSFILGGGSVELLRVYMGHSNIETTQRYLHVANNMRFCKDIYKLDDIFLTKFY
jgi:integrase/recombinase XerC/integrase/recombinase XerD